MSERPTSHFSYDRSALLYVGVTLLLGIGSLHSQNNLLFLAFGMAVGVLLVNGWYAWSSLARLRVRRHVPGHGEVGRPLTLRYHVTTSARWLPAAALLLEELGPADGARASVATVTRGRPARSQATITPARRGVLRLEGMRVSSRFPFGAVKKTARFAQPASVLIRPRKITPSDHSLLVATNARRASPVSLGRAGSGDEVFGLREFATGDAVRTIAWRASARHAKWMVREHAASATTAVRLALRLRPELSPDANEEAISLAAGTLALLHRRGQRAALLDPSAPERVIAALPAALDALARVDAAAALPDGRSRATVVIEAAEAGPSMRAARRSLRAGAAR